MNTITKHVVLVILCLMSTQLFAQDSTNTKTIPYRKNGFKIDLLVKQKETIKKEEREYLKSEVETINQRLDRREISQSEAESYKKEAAKKRALNIENRLAIVDNKISLLERNEKDYNTNIDNEDGFRISIGSFDGLTFRSKNKPRRYDRRTTSDLVFAIGINNSLIDGKGISKSPYEVLGSGFVELGWAWNTRLFKNSNAVRLKYGFSFQWNKLNVKDNLYFEQIGNQTVLTPFPESLNKSQFRVTNLVFPVHFEFGPSRKIERKNYFRYSTYNKFKVGVGGYGGFRLASQQKLKYRIDGDKVKDKIRRSYNASDFVYGVSAYIGFGETSLYMKYDLNTLFKDQLVDEYNVSLGLRFDFN